MKDVNAGCPSVPQAVQPAEAQPHNDRLPAGAMHYNPQTGQSAVQGANSKQIRSHVRLAAGSLEHANPTSYAK
jgi:hypothetical protein